MLRLPNILRLSLAVVIGFAPLLCCCGTAVADDVSTAEVAALEAHACCGSEDARPSEAPADQPDEPAPHECGCSEGEMMGPAPDEALIEATASNVLPAWLAPTYRPLLSIVIDDVHLEQPTALAGSAKWPAAPTLRTLSVLLLV
jgi:hypothetical protein